MGIAWMRDRGGERLFAVYIFIYSIYKPFECIIYSKIRLKKDKLRS